MPESSGQLSLDAGDGVPPESPGSVPGLRYIPDWITPEAGQSLLSYIDAAEWSTQLRRRVQHYGLRYDYARRTVSTDSRAADVPPLPAWARKEAVRLVREGIMGREVDQAIINEYQPGQGISPHIDCVPCFGPVVAAISLGSACVMDFTHPQDGTKISVRLSSGSLCVMTGPARYTWRHSIPARKSDPGATGRVPRERRVSMTFRTLAGPTP
jgi:alkylated DNA repair protein alkB family protein 8